MPIFISYSHQDKTFANRLAVALVKERANVWIDSWELNVGDSLMGKIQSALTDASALVVVLSKASVQSEWCKKELTAGLMRELSEKRVIVLPALLEDCDIPLFLQDKLYADFRGDFKIGFNKLVEAVSSVTSDTQGRAASREFCHDWSIGWGDRKGKRVVEVVAVTLPSSEKYSVLTQVTIVCNGAATTRYNAFEKQGFGWFARHVTLASVTQMIKPDDLRFWIEDSLPVTKTFTLKDTSSARRHDVVISTRRMGEDNGKAVIYDVHPLLETVIKQIQSTTRKLSPSEQQKLMMLLAT